MTSKLPSCHGRWCAASFGLSIPQLFDGSSQLNPCNNYVAFVNSTYGQYTPPTYVDPCCQLYCNSNHRNQLLALTCQNATTFQATCIWIFTVVALSLAFIYLLGALFQRGARLIASFGNIVLHPGVAFFASVFGTSDVDTRLYPIVAAMDVALFSYFFSGFQYSIGFAYEATATILIIDTALPLWKSLFDYKHDYNIITTNFTDPSALVARIQGMIMLALALIWTIHSMVQRTVGYRAAWIHAWKKQTNLSKLGPDKMGKNYMSDLWILAAGQGHPTWHTEIGQSVGTLMVILSWEIVAQAYEYLRVSECEETFLLFWMMLWVPPVLLTVAVLYTQFSLILHSNIAFDIASEGSLSKSLKKCLQFNDGPSREDYVASMISYRLGRNTLYVETKLEESDLKKKLFDIPVGQLLWCLRSLVHLLFYIPDVIHSSLITCLLWGGITIGRNLPHPIIVQKMKKFNIEEKRLAFTTLRTYAIGDGIAPLDSNEELDPNQIETRIKEILDPRQHQIYPPLDQSLKVHMPHISLHLLLDNVGPSTLLYLLNVLDKELYNLHDESEMISNVSSNETIERGKFEERSRSSLLREQN